MKGEKVYVRFLRSLDATEKLKLEVENKQFFEAYAMTRYPDFYTLPLQQELIEIYPALTVSKTPASASGRSTGRKSPIGWTNNQWGMKKTPTD